MRHGWVRALLESGNEGHLLLLQLLVEGFAKEKC